MKFNNILSPTLGTILIVLSCSLISAAQNQQYCNLASCRGKTNIGCGNTGAYSKNCAANAQLQTIDASMQAAIVDAHNKYRNITAGGGSASLPSAARMATMQWSSELAKMAGFNVLQCTMQHDACRNTPDLNFAGQNLYSMSWTGSSKSILPMVLSGIGAWYNEYKYTPASSITKFTSTSANNKDIGHFTQLAQEKATRVGCGVVTEKKGSWFQFYLACNYDHTNILSTPVYTTGPAASKCTTKNNPNYPNLCSLSEKYDVNSA